MLSTPQTGSNTEEVQLQEAVQPAAREVVSDSPLDLQGFGSPLDLQGSSERLSNSQRLYIIMQKNLHNYV